VQNAVARKVLHRVQRAWSRVNDVCLGVNTDDSRCASETGPSSWSYARANRSAKHEDNLVYQAADYRNLRRLVWLLQPCKEDVFYDIGCGKGRAVCVLGRCKLRLDVGIELDNSLCEVARKNAEQLRGRRSAIQIRCEDATRADVSDGTIYFMYNPFGQATMEDVLNNIHHTLSRSPRRLRIVYYNAVLEALFEACPWLILTKQIRTLTGRPINVYENAASGRLESGFYSDQVRQPRPPASVS
jgi:SAM-dependent methyltransferase